MEESTKIYILCDGEYSDYHIIGVFSDLKKLDKILRALDDSICTPSIVSMELDKIYLNRDRIPFRVWMDLEDGSDASATLLEDFLDKKLSEKFLVHDSKDWGLKRLECEIYAKSKEHAIKIVNEKRIQWLAENIGR